jgi:HrpA-like RNA helicase
MRRPTLLAGLVRRLTTLETERGPFSFPYKRCRPADRWQTAEELLPQLEALATPSGGITPAGTAPIEITRRPDDGPTPAWC